MARRTKLISDKLVLELVDNIYSAAADPAQWRILLRRLADIMGGNAASIHHQHLGMLHGNTSEFWNFDPVFLKQYEEYFCHRNVFFTIHPEIIQEGQVYPCQMLAPYDIFNRSEFYSDWMRPQDLYHGAGATIFQSEEVSSNLSIFGPRNGEAFGQAECALLAALMPHLRRAFQLHVRIQNLERRGGGAADALDALSAGVVLLDEKGKALLVNRAAHELFQRRSGLKLTPQGLVALLPSENKALQAMLQGALATGQGTGTHSGGVIAISGSGGEGPLSLLVTPLRLKSVVLGKAAPVAAVFITAPHLGPRPLARHLEVLYGLTPAEARLAKAMAEGKTVEEASDDFQVSPATVRVQLKAIFGKTATSRQSELVRLLLLGPAGFRAVSRAPNASNGAGNGIR